MPNKIKELRKSKKLSGEELGKAIGVERAMISKLERGTAKLTQHYIEKLCAALDVTSEQLLGRQPAEILHNNSIKKTQAPPRNRDIQSSIPRSKVPVYGPASAGSPDRILITDEFIVEWDYMPDELDGVRDGFKMYVAGSSMEPRYFDGEKVSVHPYKKPVINQDCVVVDDEGNALVKKYMGETDTDWKLAQYNPAKSFSMKKIKVRNLYSIVGRS